MLIALRNTVMVCFVCMFTMLATTIANSATLTATNEDQETVEWQLTAQKVSTLNDAEVVEAEGDVVLKQGKDYLKADFARFYAATNWVYLTGNVEIFMNDDNLTASTAEFDLGNKVGWMKDGKVFIAGPHVYFSGDRIQKNWGDSYSFSNAKITACDGDVPAWSFKTDEATLELEGYAVIHGAGVNIKDIPVLPVPYMVLPIKTRRESGFLRPKFGNTDRLGYWFSVPYFWAIDRERDVTLYAQYMTERGFMPGVEFRSRTSAANQVWTRFDWLSDAKTIDSVSDSTDFGYDGLLRTNKERYWVRGMFDGELPDPKWKFKADVDFASDQDFLREYKDTTAGFEDSQDELEDRFGRTLNEVDDPIRTTRVLLTRDWERLGTALLGEYNQDTRIGHGARSTKKDNELQRLPELDVYWFKNRLPGLSGIPLTFTGDFQTVQFSRSYGTDGNRVHLLPSMGLPIVTKFGTVTPRAGLRQLWYSTTDTSPVDPTENKDTRDSRTLFTFGVDGYTELARVYDMGTTLTAEQENAGKSEIVAFKHAIQPRFDYSFASGSSLRNAPQYDFVDAYKNENDLSVSLVNLLTKKEVSVVSGDEEKGVEPSLATSYGEFAWFRLLQGYDFEEADRNENKLVEGRLYENRPWRDLEAELRFYPRDWLTWTSRTFFSYYDRQIDRHDHTLTATANGYGSFSTGVDFRWNLYDNIDYAGTNFRNINVWKNELVVDFFDPFSLGVYYEYDFELKRDLEQRYSVIYNHQCFRIIFEAKFTPFDDSYKLWFEIPGLTF